MAKDALALIDHLQWNQCHVVGVSMGGMIALEFALLASNKVLSLTLLATHAGGLAGRAPFVGVHHILRSIVIRDEDLIIENALAMLYSKKTLADPEKRKVRKRFILNEINLQFDFSVFMIFILNDFEHVLHHRLLDL
jgi:pimeloyl-ACP methyl ester carboxylesterase